jgi:hypothetical protein
VKGQHRTESSCDLRPGRMASPHKAEVMGSGGAGHPSHKARVVGWVKAGRLEGQDFVWTMANPHWWKGLSIHCVTGTNGFMGKIGGEMCSHAAGAPPLPPDTQSMSQVLVTVSQL